MCCWYVLVVSVVCRWCVCCVNVVLMFGCWLVVWWCLNCWCFFDVVVGVLLMICYYDVIVWLFGVVLLLLVECCVVIDVLGCVFVVLVCSLIVLLLFDYVVMDGYVLVVFELLEVGSEYIVYGLQVVGDVVCSVYGGVWEIMIGVCLFDGLDVVVVVECIELLELVVDGLLVCICLCDEFSEGQNVCCVGVDVVCDVVVFDVGVRVGFVYFMLFVVVGVVEVIVMWCLCVVVIGIGKEFVFDLCQCLVEGQIYSLNVLYFGVVFIVVGVQVFLCEVVDDIVVIYVDVVCCVQVVGVDLVVSIGVVLMGCYDFVFDVLCQFGVYELFYKVVMCFGKLLFVVSLFGGLLVMVLFGMLMVVVVGMCFFVVLVL